MRLKYRYISFAIMSAFFTGAFALDKNQSKLNLRPNQHIRMHHYCLFQNIFSQFHLAATIHQSAIELHRFAIGSRGQACIDIAQVL
jgi:hypothetical protein